MKKKSNIILDYNPRLKKEYKKIKTLKIPKDLLRKHKPLTKGNPYPVELTKAEINLIKRLVSIEPIQEFIRERKGFPTYDFCWKGCQWEVKTIIGNNPLSVKYIIWRATDQNKRNIILDTSFTSMSLSDIEEQVIKHLSIRKNMKRIGKLLLVRGKTVIRMK